MNVNFVPLLPEIFLVIMIILILLVDAFTHEHNKAINTVMAIVSLIGAFIIQLVLATPKATIAFGGMFILDGMATGMKLLLYVCGVVIILYAKQYIIDKKMLRGEFYAIFLFAILGMMVMISANNMLILYVGLELLSLSLYGLVALNRDSLKATEAAMKFFILGALASGLLLFGISFIYGATGGSLQLDKVFLYIYQSGGSNPALLVFGLVFIVAGLMFKLGIAPFHMWVPDVYEGAPIAVTMVIGTITKLAAIVFIIRFLISGLVILSDQWSLMLLVLGILSLFIGNIVAIAQTNIKRMIGYSAIANMAFVVFGLLAVSVNGLTATLFYMIAYVITSLAGFGILTLLSHDGYECETINDLRGLSRSHPIYAGMLLLVMFSLAGIPPLVGFYAKFRILEALIASGYLKTAIYAVVMSLIGAFYYIRVVKVMYFDKQELSLLVADAGLTTKVVLVINSLLILTLGIMPNYLLEFCTKLISN